VKLTRYGLAECFELMKDSVFEVINYFNSNSSSEPIFISKLKSLVAASPNKITKTIC
jgi:hypothetical protein